MHLPQELHDPLGAGISGSQAGSDTSSESTFVHLPQQLHDPLGAGIPHSQAGNDTSTQSAFVHLPQQLYDPLGAGISPLQGGSDTLSQSLQQVDNVPGSELPQNEAGRTKFSHVPIFRNPRGAGMAGAGGAKGAPK